MESTSRPSRAIAIIPARGGSKGIPRKNIRELAGKPLLWYMVRTALEAGCFAEVVVSTDHDEIAHIAEECGARVHRRPSHMADDHTTLDSVIYDAVQARGGEYDLVVTLQPTAPLLKPETLRDAVRRAEEDPSIDTLISVVNEPRLSWVERDGRIVPNYAERLNRQMLPPLYRETGAFFISRMRCVTPTSRFGPNVSVYEISHEEAIDIDTMQDWWIVEKLLERRRIAIRVDGHSLIGFGHIYRMLLLANRLLDHAVHFFLDEEQTKAVSMVRNAFYPFTAAPRSDLPDLMEAHHPDIVVLDILDTSAEEVLFFKRHRRFVVSFEDLGPGIEHANLVINALYDASTPHPHVVSGPDYYCLRAEFSHTAPRELSQAVRKIVISFGGSDPTNVTHRAVTVLRDFVVRTGACLTIILGLGYPEEAEKSLRAAIAELAYGPSVEIKRHVQSMAREFKEADLVLTSCGRTMYEVASLGVPAILIAQNMRETHHVFGHAENGFVNLGLGAELSDSRLAEAVREVAESFERRSEMRKRMLSYDFRKGLDRVARLILERYEEQRHVCGQV
jgi:CMP-N-acetylneuraminic acid synthetase